VRCGARGVEVTVWCGALRGIEVTVWCAVVAMVWCCVCAWCALCAGALEKSRRKEATRRKKSCCTTHAQILISGLVGCFIPTLHGEASNYK
jgi:hypothetical protein